ncbi:MAG: aldehyde ferredoxin oxidoreductase family protein [Promethearchaeota archaeon]
MKGMNGKLLAINLSKGENGIKIEELSDDVFHKYIGGRGLAVKILTERIKPKINPLSKENVLVFTIGPLTGTSVPTSGRFSMATKSVLTGGIHYSNCGGFFGPYLKSCGYDGIVIEGQLDNPGYLVIEKDGKVLLKDASFLWGKDTEETLKMIREREGNNAQVLMIGIAGENHVRFASIMLNAERAFARGGVGAIMGIKRLKAIVVKKGTTKQDVDNPELLKITVKTGLEKIKVVPITRVSLPKFGTAGLVNVINGLGMFPIRNFKEGQSSEAENVSGEALRREIFVKDEGCYGCPIRCGRKTKAGDMEGKGPEYESLWALGPNLGVFDLVSIAQANYLCNKYGMDTISTGGTIACAMELNELNKLNGLNKLNALNGLNGLNQSDKRENIAGSVKDNDRATSLPSDIELSLKSEEIRFGDAKILNKLIMAIAYREGIGHILAEGAKRLAEKSGMPQIAMHVKGLELPAYDPRGAFGHALGYATANRGGDHLTGYLAAMEIFAAPKKINRFTTGGKADLLVLKQNQSAVEDSLVVCKFAGWALGYDFYTRMITAITGWDYNITELMKIGARIYNLERLFNIREGFSKKDDNLPNRFLSEPFKEGHSKNKVVPLDSMLVDYYAVRGWDSNGIPKKETLKDLDLADLEK